MADYEIFIPCRVNSHRLPFKHFRTIAGRTLIEHLITSLMDITDARLNLIVPEGVENDIYTELESLYPVQVFRGHETDVLDRFVSAIEQRKDETHYAVRINGDSLFPLPELFAQLDDAMSDKAHDIYTTVGSNVPSGRHVEAVRISWLMEQSEAIAAATPEQREHVFPLLYDLSESTGQLRASSTEKGRFAVDNFHDLSRVTYIVEQRSERPDASLFDLSEEFEDRAPYVGQNGAYLIAEIGGNHEGDFDYAKKLVQSACSTEVDAVKLQIYSPDLLVNRRIDPDRWAHFKKFALSAEQYRELFAIIRDAGKHTSASVWSLEEMAEHEDDIDVLKVGSGDLNNAPMLEYLAKLGKPVVLSTGLTTLDQADLAQKIILDAGLPPEKLAILQCTSMYPIPDVEANLAVMDEFARRFDCVIGYSDHTVGHEVLVDSVLAGAKVLEFHFSDDTSNAGFRDHLVSLDEAGTAALVEGMKTKMMRLGAHSKHLTMMERARNHPVSFRKGVFLRHDVPAGHVITSDDLIALRPLAGIDAFEFNALVGKTAAQPIEELEALSWNMFEGASAN